MTQQFPSGGVTIVEAKHFGSNRTRKYLVFDGSEHQGVRESKVVASFSTQTPFAYQISQDDLGPYGPMTAVYTLVRQEPCTEEFWQERKKDFSRSFSQKVASFKRQYQGMMMNDMVRRGILVKLANEAAQGCFWNVVILGVGPVICEEKDPFDLK